MRVVHGRLRHQDGLEPPGERRVLLDVLAVLVERGRADDMQLAAGKRGLDHVGGVDAALGAGAGPDNRVYFVNEDHELVAVLADLVDDPAQALFEVAAIAGAGDHAGELELDDALAGQRLRDLLVDDALGDALHDGCLADSGLADQHRVVLAAAGQHLDGLLDLAVPADNGVNPAFPRHRGQVTAELVQRRRRGGPAVLARRAALGPAR